MATSLAGKISLLINMTNTKALDLDTIRDPLTLSRGVTLADGAGANQANAMFHDSRTLADGANEILDLYASGTLLDALGSAVAMHRIKALYIKNNSADASLKVCGGTTPVGLMADASDILIIPPGGEFLFIAPSAAGILITTNKNLKLEHDGVGSSTLTYDIVVIGANS